VSVKQSFLKTKWLAYQNKNPPLLTSSKHLLSKHKLSPNKIEHYSHVHTNWMSKNTQLYQFPFALSTITALQLLVLNPIAAGNHRNEQQGQAKCCSNHGVIYPWDNLIVPLIYCFRSLSINSTRKLTSLNIVIKFIEGLLTV